jgi:SAM-dependent MidA family methyltransferase
MVEGRSRRTLAQDPADPEPSLQAYLRQQIENHPQGRISFAEFMEVVLYHSDYGYYSTQATIGSRSGDFVTSPNLCADFGELLAEQFHEIWHRLDCPQPFKLIEMGAGQGSLAQDVLHWLAQQHPPCFAATQYGIVERSPRLRQVQRDRLQPFVLQDKVQWYTWADLPSDSVVGCFFSNELVDAFPVHQVIRHQGQLQEIYVTLADTPADARFTLGRPNPESVWCEVIDSLSTERLSNYLAQSGIHLEDDVYTDGYRTEVNLAALDWLALVGDRLHQGYVLTIDYGYPAHRYYSPARSQGTLQCYYQHAHHSNPYIHLGRQDLTTHVNFTALEQQGESCGLQTVGFTQQGLFLMALGLGDRLVGLSAPKSGIDLQTLLTQREALHGLMDPLGVGNFGVLLQSKGLDLNQPPLKGFCLPAMT